MLILTEGRYDEPGSPCRLVHGFPRLTRADGDVPAGTLYGHAWLERESATAEIAGVGLIGLDVAVAIDVIKGVVVPRALFYHIGQIDPAHVARYTKAEAYAMMEEHATYGPWHAEPPGVVWPE